MQTRHLALLLCVGTACGGSSATPTDGSTVGTTITAAGMWTGITGAAASQTISIQLAENGGVVTGTATVSNMLGGDRTETVNGTFESPAINATLTSGTTQPITLKGTVTAFAIVGNVTGSGFFGDAITLNKSGSTVDGSGDWLGTWTLFSVNGIAGAPINVLVLGYANRIVSRSITVKADGTATWSDSTLSSQPCTGQPAGTLCDAGGRGTVAWVATNGLTLKAVRVVAATGRIATVKTFVKQPDGSLLKTDDGETEVYKKQ
jgi:hypothetical protein